MIDFPIDQLEPCPLNGHDGECVSCPDRDDENMLCNLE